jgi:hypothetical protein
MGSSGSWNGMTIGGSIGTSHGNVNGISIFTAVNGGDANYTGLSISPQGTATLPQVQGINVSVDNLACSAQKTGLQVSGGKTNLSSPYHTDILPPSPGFLDFNSIGAEFWVKPGFPTSSTLVFGVNLGQSFIFEDDTGSSELAVLLM